MIEIRVLGCYGGESHGHHSSGYLINRKILLEAGSVTTGLSEEDQLYITQVLISHAHLDHTKELIFLVDNFFSYGRKMIRLRGIPEVMLQLKDHLFNDEIWPDFTRIPAMGEPVIQIEELNEMERNSVDDLLVTPIRVNHTVPTSGFIIESEASAVVYSGDTGPTDQIWEVAGGLPHLKAVLVETSFPNGHQELALQSGHLTPSLLEGELKKLNRPDVPVYIGHMKPAFIGQITAQLSALEGYNIIPLTQDKVYSF